MSGGDGAAVPAEEALVSALEAVGVGRCAPFLEGIGLHFQRQALRPRVTRLPWR